MDWSSEAYKSAQGIINKIKSHPMVLALASGNLGTECFEIYQEQDRIYLDKYSEVLKQRLGMLVQSDEKQVFAQFVNESLDAEVQANNTLLKTETAMPLTLEYLSHYDECAESGNAAIAMASILPCNWIYYEVGQHIAELSGNRPNPYSEWIALYSDELMKRGAELCRKICDRLASEESDETWHRMTEVFVKSVEYEYLFWEQAWQAAGHKNDMSVIL